MTEIISSNEAAQQLGVTTDHLRVIKNRNKTRLVEGIHWVKSGSETCWTVAGLAELRAIRGGETPTPTLNQHPDLSLLQPIARPLAEQWVQQHLPGAIAREVQILLSPRTSEDEARLNRILELSGFILAATAMQEAIAGARQDFSKQLMGA